MITEEQIENVKKTWSWIVKLEEEQRAVSLPDALYVYTLIRKYKPKVVVELGTWIGTVTRVIMLGMFDNDNENIGDIYTCDKRHAYLTINDKVKYYNCKSTKMLKKLSKEGIKIDFCFVDACLQKKDPKLIKGLFRDKVVFATHDFKEPDDKGIRNIKLMKDLLKKKDIGIVSTKTTLFGNQINNSVALLEEY